MDKILSAFDNAQGLLADIGQGSLLLYAIVMLSWVAVKVVEGIDKHKF